MPRPTSKAQLLQVMQERHTALEKFLESLTPDQITRVSKTTRWSMPLTFFSIPLILHSTFLL